MDQWLWRLFEQKSIWLRCYYNRFSVFLIQKQKWILNYRIYRIRNMLIRDLRDYSKETIKKVNPLSGTLRAVTSEKRIANISHYPNTNTQFIRVGAYKFREQDAIGKGFSSSVYKGYNIHQNNQKEYAIKVINLKKFKNIQMLEKQIEISKELSHPNIVKFYNSYKTEDYYYIITEYCESGDLAQYIKKNRRLPEKEAEDIVKQIIEGCLYLFRRRILHRDLKPANIMKMNDQWKLGDFGFSTKCQQTALFDRVNVGTPLYMPPQALNLNKYSFKSDIFAIGIIFYELVTGKTPWPCKTQKQLINKMKNVPLPKLENISSRLSSFYMKACETDETRRMKITDLEEFVQNCGSTKVFENKENIPMNKSLRNLHQLNSEKCSIATIGNSTRNIGNESEKYINQEESSHKSIMKKQGKKHTLKIVKPSTPNSGQYSLMSNFFGKSMKNLGTPTAQTLKTKIKIQSIGSENKQNKLNLDMSRKLKEKECESTEISQQESQKIIYDCIKNTASDMKYLKLNSQSPNSSSVNQKSIFNRNTRSLLNELQFCRLIYYMIKNVQYFVADTDLLLSCIDSNQGNSEKSHRMFLALTLFKNLLRCIKQLEDPKQYFEHILITNTSTSYFQSKEYRSLASQIHNYAKRYERQYLDILKKTDISIIRAVNRKFPELSYTTSFSKQFYSNLLDYFKKILLACDHQIVLNIDNVGLVNKCFATLNQETGHLSANLEYLRSLQFLCEILKQKQKNAKQSKNNDNTPVQKQADDKESVMNKICNRIVLDYSNSKLNEQDYFGLRQKIVQI